MTGESELKFDVERLVREAEADRRRVDAQRRKFELMDAQLNAQLQLAVMHMSIALGMGFAAILRADLERREP